MADAASKNRRRKHLTVEEKAMICNVYEGLRKRDPNISKVDAVTTCSFLTKVNESSIYRCLKTRYSGPVGVAAPKEEVRGRKKITIDDDTRYAIRRIVHSFFFRNEIPNLKKISAAIMVDDSLPKISRQVLLRTLKDMNFRYLKRNRRSMLIEKPEIVIWRRKYLEKVRQFRREGKRIYWMDETWLNEGHTVKKVWQDLSITSSRQAFLDGFSTGLKDPSSRGRRLIITHIGSDCGFLEGGLLLFESKKTGDYHEEMNADTFEKWFASVLPLVEPGSVIVMDNAPYHSRRLEQQPTSAWRKGQIIDWLQKKAIEHHDQMLKVELLNIARQNKSEHVKYVVDELARQNNVEVLRLPPYHCEFNPIELIWAQVKGEVARKNTSFKLGQIKNLFNEAIQNVTANDWQKCIGHVKKVEDRMWELDVRAEVLVEPLIIQTGNESDKENDSDMSNSGFEDSDSE